MLLISSKLLVTDASFCVCDLTFLLHVSLLWLFLYLLGSNWKERTASQALPFSIRSKSCPKKCSLGPRHDEERYRVFGGNFSTFSQRITFPCHGLMLLALPCMSSPHPNTAKGRNLWIPHFWGDLLKLSCISCLSDVRAGKKEIVFSEKPQRTSPSWWQSWD